MAKKKNKKSKPQPVMSPERYIREKARTLPIGKCYVSPANWQEQGICHVIVTRVRPSGNLVVADYLVDTFCLGVKDVMDDENMTPEMFDRFLASVTDKLGRAEISYNEAHNIIYGAIEFAEEGGVYPAKEFNLTKYILEEDTDDIPLIEYEFGKDGKHYLIPGPTGKEKVYFNTLRENLGDDFDYIMPIGEDHEESKYYDDDNDKIKSKMLEVLGKMQENMEKFPEEEYSYHYPTYPQQLNVKHQFIADELLSPDNFDGLPREVIERILALPSDEAAADISNIILYTIGKTYKAINDDTIEEPTDAAIMHGVQLLTQLKNEKGLDAILEVMRQNSDFSEYHLGDYATEYLYPAVYACGLNNLMDIEKYLNHPGLYSILKSQAVDALVMIAQNHPERRDEIIEVFRRLLTAMVEKLPQRKGFDGTFAGFVMNNLIELRAKELIPEIKQVFATGCVNDTISGEETSIISEIEKGRGVMADAKYKFPDIFE